MNTPTPLLTLCAAATKGPYKANQSTVRVDSPNRHEQDKVCAVAGPTAAAPEAWEGIHRKRHATAQLIARIASPEVAAKVYAALQANKVLLERIQVERTFSQDAALNATTQALNLLDGKTT